MFFNELIRSINDFRLIQTLFMNKEKFLLFTLAAIQFTNVMDFMIMMPLGPQLMRLFSINPHEFSLIVSSYTFSAGIFGFIGAFFIDKFDRKTALFTIFVGFTLGTLFCGLAQTYWILLFARIFTGMFGGILGALVLAIIGDVIPIERRASAMGIVMAAFSVASVVGVPFGLFLANQFTWQMPFFLLAFLGVVVLAMIFFLVPSMKEHLRKKGSNQISPFQFVMSIRQNRNQLLALAMMVCIMLSQFSYISLLSPFMVSNVGLTEHQITYIYLLGGLATIVSSPLTGKLADKYGKAKIFTIYSFLYMIPLLLITNLSITALWVVLIFTTFNFIVISGRMIPGSTMITATVHPQNRGSFMSINSCVQQLSSGLGAYMAGIIVTKDAVTGQLGNYNFVGYAAFFFVIVAIILANMIKPLEVAKPELETV